LPGQSEAQGTRTWKVTSAIALYRTVSNQGRACARSDGAKMTKSDDEPIRSADWPDDQVRSISAWCEYNDISPATGRREIAAGRGPVITHLSPRRLGIRGRHNRAWQDGRASQKGGTLASNTPTTEQKLR
jgi:hypothetical protein